MRKFVVYLEGEREHWREIRSQSAQRAAEYFANRRAFETGHPGWAGARDVVVVEDFDNETNIERFTFTWRAEYTATRIKDPHG